MGIFDRFRKEREPRVPYESGVVPSCEKSRPVLPSMPEGKNLFSEKVIAKLKEKGLTLSWRYSYKLAIRYEVKRVCSGGQAVVYIVEDSMEKGKRHAAKSLKAHFRKPEKEVERAHEVC